MFTNSARRANQAPILQYALIIGLIIIAVIVAISLLPQPAKPAPAAVARIPEFQQEKLPDVWPEHGKIHLHDGKWFVWTRGYFTQRCDPYLDDGNAQANGMNDNWEACTPKDAVDFLEKFGEAYRNLINALKEKYPQYWQ